MHIGSGLNTVSSLYGQQKGNQMKTPASGEKTFYTAVLSHLNIGKKENLDYISY